MKNIFFLLLILVGISSANAQKVSRDKVKRDFISYPTIPVENLKKVAVKIYYPNADVTQDSIRKYGGGKLITEGISLESRKEYSYNQIQIVDSDWDLLLEVFFGEADFQTKEIREKKGKNPLGEEYTAYFYSATQLIPTYAKLSGKDGARLDLWKEEPANEVKFGLENITTSSEDNSELVLYYLNFSTKSDLDDAFDSYGRTYMHQLGVKAQIEKVLLSLDKKIFFTERTDKYTIASAKGSSFDYSELDIAQENAVRAIKDGDFSKLDALIPVWEKYIEKADKSDKKAMINAEVYAALNGNIALAHIYNNRFEEAKKYAYEYALYAKHTGMIDYNDAIALYYDTYNFQKAKLNNGHISPTFNKVKALDFSKEILQRNRNYNNQFFYVENRLKAIESEYEELYAKPKENANESKTEEGNPYKSRVTDLTQGPSITLFLNQYDDPDLIGKSFPKVITELVEVATLRVTNLKLTDLPDNFGDMKKLKKVILKGNAFTEVPSSIGQLSNLKELDLSDNQLTALPETIKNCKSLKTIYLDGNNISGEELAKIKSWLPNCKIK